MNLDLLTRVPAELLSAALCSLPDPASSEEDTRPVVVELRDGVPVEITFTRLQRARHSLQPLEPRWYWTPASAVIVKCQQCGASFQTGAEWKLHKTGIEIRAEIKEALESTFRPFYCVVDICAAGQMRFAVMKRRKRIYTEPGIPL